MCADAAGQAHGPLALMGGRPSPRPGRRSQGEADVPGACPSGRVRAGLTLCGGLFIKSWHDEQPPRWLEAGD